jgi:CRISPR-associated protein Csx14
MTLHAEPLNKRTPGTMIATLGGQPQVVTFALDHLLKQNRPIQKVILISLSAESERFQNSIEKIADELSSTYYKNYPIKLEVKFIGQDDNHLPDIRNESQAQVAWDFVNALICAQKEQQQMLDVVISGGRRMLGMLTMSAAMLYFGHQDRLWHMYTDEDWQQRSAEGAIMHLPNDIGDRFRMMQVPMMPWGSYFPTLRQLANRTNPIDLIEEQRAFIDHGEKARCLNVFKQLTNRQKANLIAFAKGHRPQEVAELLSVSLRTVDSHKTIILAECRNEWAYSDEIKLDYRFLHDKFGPVLTDQFLESIHYYQQSE